MSSLRESIPEGFYNIFGPQREVYFIFLKTIYSSVINGRYSIKGITIDECRSLVKDIIIEDSEENFEDNKFNSRYISYLIEKGWLKVIYDPIRGSDVIIFPQYSALFIEVIFKLDEDIEKISNRGMRDIHSQIRSFSFDTTDKNIEGGYAYLIDAINSVNEYCIKITSFRDMIQLKFESVLQAGKDTGEEINTDIFEKYIRFDKDIRNDVNEVLANGEFYRHIEDIEELLLSVNEKIGNFQDLLFSMKIDINDNTDAKIIEDEENRVIRLLDDIAKFKQALDSAESLYAQTLEEIGHSAKLAYQRARFMNIFESSESKANLVYIISALGNVSKEEKDTIIEDISNKIQISSEFKILESSGIKLIKQKKKREFKPVYVDITDNNIEDFQIKNAIISEKFSKDEIIEFESHNTKENKICIGSHSIQTTEDFEKVVELWFRVAEANRINVKDLKLSENPIIVRINGNVCFEFNEFEYIREREIT